MINTANNRAVLELFGIGALWHFEVPRYQREYVWKREHWEQLFDDLWNNDPGYFLGSIITVNRTKGSIDPAVLDDNVHSTR